MWLLLLLLSGSLGAWITIGAAAARYLRRSPHSCMSGCHRLASTPISSRGQTRVHAAAGAPCCGDVHYNSAVRSPAGGVRSHSRGPTLSTRA